MLIIQSLKAISILTYPLNLIFNPCFWCSQSISNYDQISQLKFIANLIPVTKSILLHFLINNSNTTPINRKISCINNITSNTHGLINLQHHPQIIQPTRQRQNLQIQIPTHHPTHRLHLRQSYHLQTRRIHPSLFRSLTSEDNSKLASKPILNTATPKLSAISKAIENPPPINSLKNTPVQWETKLSLNVFFPITQPINSRMIVHTRKTQCQLQSNDQFMALKAIRTLSWQMPFRTFYRQQNKSRKQLTTSKRKITAKLLSIFKRLRKTYKINTKWSKICMNSIISHSNDNFNDRKCLSED